MPSAAVTWLFVAPSCSFHMLGATSHPCMNQSQGYTPSLATPVPGAGSCVLITARQMDRHKRDAQG